MKVIVDYGTYRAFITNLVVDLIENNLAHKLDRCCVIILPDSSDEIGCAHFYPCIRDGNDAVPYISSSLDIKSVAANSELLELHKYDVETKYITPMVPVSVLLKSAMLFDDNDEVTITISDGKFIISCDTHMMDSDFIPVKKFHLTKEVRGGRLPEPQVN